MTAASTKPTDEMRALAAQAVKEEKASRGFTLWDIFWDDPDDNLTRHRRRCERAIEDGATGHARRVLERELGVIRYVKLARWALRMRYGAHRFGTNEWVRYHRHDERPSFRLAIEMDQRRAEMGFPHIIDWTYKSITTLRRPVQR